MKFDFRTRAFIDDGLTNQFTIDSIAMMEMATVSPAAFGIGGGGTGIEEDKSTKFENPVLRFEDGILKVFSSGVRVRTLNQLFFIMNESEVSNAQRNLYSRGFESAGEAIAKRNVLTEIEKKAVQKCIDDMAEANGIVLPPNMGYFNDRLILYMYPFIRSFSNSETNFHKILEDMKNFANGEEISDGYKISFEMFDNTNLNDFVKAYLGTGSKEITKFIASRFVVKTDLVKSLSPELLTLLVNNSSKIFGISTETKILTQYEDIMFDVLTFVRYIMDIFEGNVDYTQQYLASKATFKWGNANKKIMAFLRDQFSPKKRMKIMMEDKDFDYSLRDVASQIAEYDSVDKIPYKLRFDYPEGLRVPKNWKTFKELHDKVSVDYKRIKAEDNNKTIPYTEVEWGLHGMKKDNIELVLPSEGKTLVEWGSTQEHCVASYADRAANKECLIMGIKVDGEHKYTAELRIHQREIAIPPQRTSVGMNEELQALARKTQYSFHIQQFYAKNNKRPEDLGDTKTIPMVKQMIAEVLQGNEMVTEYTIRNGFENNNLQAALEYGGIAMGIDPGGDANVVIQDVAVE